MTTLRTALVIPVHNRRETTLRALRSLSRINRTGLEVRIFVVDDGSSDGTSESIQSEFPEVELILGDGTLHYAAGTNRGITAAIAWNADFIVTMNDDSVFHEDFLVSLVRASRDSGGAVVGSLLLLWDVPHIAFQVDPKWIPSRAGWVFPQDLTAFSLPKEPFEVDCIVGNCVLFPASAIKEQGLMDEKAFPNGWGDAQFTTRIKKGGWTLLVDPRSRVWCEPNTYPPPLRLLTVSEVVRVLFRDSNHPANLRRQFKAIWHSAPSRLSALAAFGYYVAGLSSKALRLRRFTENSTQ